MKRRDFLALATKAGAAALVLGPPVLLAGCANPTTGAKGPSPKPKPKPPGSSPPIAPSAPTDADWAGLARRMSGNLVLPNSPAYTAARQSYDPIFDSNSPQAVAYCRTNSDVQTGVDFARTHGVALTPRCGGHSYAGYSTGPGLVLDVSSMNTIEAGPTAGVGAGSRLIDVYGALAAGGVSIPAGSCPTVGVAGLTLGGGVGVTSRAYGLTCDRLSWIEIVTADGRLRRVHAGSDPDLFWACRGGGGGNFGVVTKFGFNTHPISPVSVFSLAYDWNLASGVLAGWQAWAPDAPDRLFSNLHLDSGTGRPGGRPTLSVAGVYLGPAHDLDRLLGPLTETAGGAPRSRYQQDTSYLEAMMIEAGCAHLSPAQCHLAQSGSPGTLSRQAFVAKSDFFRASMPTEGISILIEAMSARAASPGTGAVAVILDAWGGAISRVSPTDSAFVARRARFSAQYYAGLPTDASLNAIHTASAALNGLRAKLAPYASGYAYLNYIDPDLANWPQAYYGTNYPRLTRVKSAYDPQGVFRFPQGITPLASGVTS